MEDINIYDTVLVTHPDIGKDKLAIVLDKVKEIETFLDVWAFDDDFTITIPSECTLTSHILDKDYLEENAIFALTKIVNQYLVDNSETNFKEEFGITDFQFFHYMRKIYNRAIKTALKDAYKNDK